jgi:hypothetical protein
MPLAPETITSSVKRLVPAPHVYRQFIYSEEGSELATPSPTLAREDRVAELRQFGSPCQ